jgi:hypothetical protein
MTKHRVRSLLSLSERIGENSCYDRSCCYSHQKSLNSRFTHDSCPFEWI